MVLSRSVTVSIHIDQLGLVCDLYLPGSDPAMAVFCLFYASLFWLAQSTGQAPSEHIVPPEM